MENSLFIALSRQMTVRRQLESVANNLANANTAGYKSERLMFVEYLSKSDNGKSQMHFVQDLASARNHNPGKYEQSGNAFDMAIEGPGFFVVETPQGEQRFTRDGQFRMDQDGKLITRDGFPVLGEGDAPILFQPNDVDIAVRADGTVSAGDQVRGKLKIVEFENPYRMKRAEGNLLKSNDAPDAAEKSSVIQGMIEGSNVQPILEITEMMHAMRSYQSAGKFIESEHERQRRAIDRLTRETS